MERHYHPTRSLVLSFSSFLIYVVRYRGTEADREDTHERDGVESVVLICSIVVRLKGQQLSSTKRRNLVIIGGGLWSDEDRRRSTSMCKRIMQELSRAGSDIDVFALRDLDLGIKDGEIFIALPDGRLITTSSENLPRWCIGYVIPPRITYVLEQMGIACFSSYEMVKLMEDKVITHAAFADVIPQPDTLFYGSDSTVDGIVNTPDAGKDESSSYPFMIKGSRGAGGINVEKVFGKKDISDFIEAHEDCGDIMLQQAMATGDDVRVYCLGDEIVSSVLRKPQVGIWKANLEFSPTRRQYRLSKEETKMIKEAMSILPAKRRGLYTFDFLFDQHGDLIMCEGNCNVGTNALETCKLDEGIFLRYVDYVRREMQREANESNVFNK